MLVVRPPAPELSAMVSAYWFVKDLCGDHAGRLVRTSPIPMAVLSINIGRANTTESGVLVPNVSLLGLQSQSRAWRSCSQTYFVMVMLTIPGFVRLFPHTGAETADALLDLAAHSGDATAKYLENNVSIEHSPERITALMDEWLIARVRDTRPIAEAAEIGVAQEVLRSGGTVGAAAAKAGIDRRQLHRLFYRHLGRGPKDVADLERLHSSLRSLQSGLGDPIHGFSDQAHQIRSWRRRLGTTPGAYTHEARSPLTDQFEAQRSSSKIAYYL